MIPSSKVLWGEGLFLRPQHFQRQDAYHEWRLAETARVLHPHAWGVRRLEVDVDALAGGLLRFRQLQVVFPDGELYAAPREDELPAPLVLDALPAAAGDRVFHLALPPMRDGAANCAAPGDTGEADRRYVRHARAAGDWFTDAAESDVLTLRRRVRLVADDAPRTHLASLPVCRIRRTSTGSYQLDEQFVPPVASIEAAPPLVAVLGRLLDVLQAKVDALQGLHREPSQHVIEFRSGDVASFWLLHTAHAAFASLSHLHRQPGLHPERLFERLLELAGALMTFSRRHGLADLPAYDHAAPGPAFARLDAIVRDLLETVISTRSFRIALDEVRPSFHHGRLDSERIDAETHLYLGVQAALPPAELVEAVPLRFKVGAPDDVEQLVLSAMGGVRLHHAAQVPAAIPVRPGTFYFALDPRGPLHERMLQARTITVYAPAGLPELRLELFALRS